MIQLIILMLAVIGGFFDWVKELISDLCDSVCGICGEDGLLSTVGHLIALALCCIGYWWVGDYAFSGENWVQYCVGMCRVGFFGGILSVIAYSVYEYLYVVSYDYRFVFMIPLLVSGLGFFVFGIPAAAGLWWSI